MANKKKVGILLGDTDLKRRYPTSGIADDILLKSEDRIWLPSRVLSSNWQLGGGIPYGKILDGHGEESTGKTLLAYDFAYVAQQLGGIVLWDDAEASFDRAWAESHGLDLGRVDLLPDENIIEVVSDWMADKIVYWRSKLTNNEPILLVIDSIAALDTMVNMESADSDSGEDMGRRSKWIYQMLRKRNPIIAKYGVCVYCINQLRKKVGATKWEDPDTVPGGTAMKYYASQRMGIYRSKQIKDSDDDVVGNTVRIVMKKNKVAAPKKKIYVDVYFTEVDGKYGYDRYSGLEDILVDYLHIVKRKKGLYYYKGELIARGEQKFKKLLEEDAKMRMKLLKRAKINSISQAREKIASIEENLYPVKLKKKSDRQES